MQPFIGASRRSFAFAYNAALCATHAALQHACKYRNCGKSPHLGILWSSSSEHSSQAPTLSAGSDSQDHGVVLLRYATLALLCVGPDRESHAKQIGQWCGLMSAARVHNLLRKGWAASRDIACFAALRAACCCAAQHHKIAATNRRFVAKLWSSRVKPVGDQIRKTTEWSSSATLH